MAITLSCNPKQRQQLSPSNHLLHHSRMTCDTGTICLGSSALGRPSIRHMSTVDKIQTQMEHRRRRHIIPHHRSRTTRAMVPGVVPITISHTRIITCTRMPPGTDCRRCRWLSHPSPSHIFITVHLDDPNHANTQYHMLRCRRASIFSPMNELVCNLSL
jgi:hypothetical protein